MKAKDIKLNDRVEYAIKRATPGGKSVERQFAVGYVKRIYRKLFTTYVDIYETRSRRVDTVKLRDVFGVADRQCYTQAATNNNNNY